jgi:hypothetical protein
MKKSIKKTKEHVVGRIAANPRRANIAEGLALQMLRPFAALAPVPREQDFGIDVVATLLRQTGKALTASGLVEATTLVALPSGANVIPSQVLSGILLD